MWFDFSVVATDEVKAAVSMICDPDESQFNLVMAKDDMPNMDALSFLQFMLEKYIPVICKFHSDFSIGSKVSRNRSVKKGQENNKG